MTEQDIQTPNGVNDPVSGAARKNRGIRFSNAEWRQVEQLALERSVTASELVRQTMVSMINRRLPAWYKGDMIALPSGIQAQIEQIYRGVYILATLKRDELYEAGQREKLDAVHAQARGTQVEIMEDAES